MTWRLSQACALCNAWRFDRCVAPLVDTLAAQGYGACVPARGFAGFAMLGLAQGARPMVATYAPLLLMFVFAGLVVLGFFFAGQYLGPKNPTTDKLMPFESGNESPGTRKVRLSVKYYLTAILFVIFDIEAVFLYLWAVRFRSLGWIGLVSMTGFLAVLIVGLVYALRKGALEWEK